jgi:hypothetical protein
VALSAPEPIGSSHHQLEQTELAFFVVEKKVQRRNRPWPRRAVQVGFVLLQPAYGFVAFHKISVANWSLRFHDSRAIAENA